jgi:hypothetical protein
LKRGDEQAGQEYSVRVAPCLSKSAIILMFLDSLDTTNPSEQTLAVGRYIFVVG